MGQRPNSRKNLIKLLREAAEVSVSLDRAEGTIVGVPHYSVIEGRAHELGEQLSRRIQAQHMGDLAAHAAPSAKCPECGTRCDTARKKRQVRSVDGTLTVDEPVAHCPKCRRGSFPLREAMGFDARELTPLLVQRIAVAAAELCSFERAAIVMKQVGDQGVSAKTIERVAHDLGPEFAERRDSDPKTDEALAMRSGVALPNWPSSNATEDGFLTREPGHGPGVHSTTEGWRETKNAVLIRASRTVSIDDPQPEPPACFCDSEHVAKIAKTAVLLVASSSPGSAPNHHRGGLPRASQAGRKPTIGVPSGWSALCSPASPSQRFSASRWSVRPSEGDSSRPTPRRSWGMGCPGTGQSGRSTSPTSRRSWISSTC